MVVQKERVVAKGRHGYTHLGKVVQVLQSRYLRIKRTMDDTCKDFSGNNKTISYLKN